MSAPGPQHSPDLTTTAILLDVDGTILDIAPTPREVFVPHSLRETLTRLSERSNGAVAFVSGRPVGGARSHLLTPPIAGDRRPWRGDAHRHGRGARPTALAAAQFGCEAQICRHRRSGTGDHPGGQGLLASAALPPGSRKGAHCPGVGRKHLRGAFGCRIELLPGKLVVEIKQTGVTKATAVRELMACRPFAGRRPISSAMM